MTWIDREQTRGYGRCPDTTRRPRVRRVWTVLLSGTARTPGAKARKVRRSITGSSAGGLRVRGEGMQGVGQPGRVHTGASLQVGRESSRTPRKGAGPKTGVLRGAGGEGLLLPRCYQNTRTRTI